MPLRACLRRSQPLVPAWGVEHKNKQNRVGEGEVFQKAHGCICLNYAKLYAQLRSPADSIASTFPLLIPEHFYHRQISDFETYVKFASANPWCQKQYHTIAGGSSDCPKVDGQAVFLQRDQAPGHPSIEIDSQRSYCPKTNQHLPNPVDLTGTHKNLKLFEPTMMGLS